MERVIEEDHYVMGNTAIARGAIESGVRVVAGYPGTPATEIVDDRVGYSGVHVEWSSNEKVAFEIALGVSLCHVRSMAVMKHNGTNMVTDFLMHVNFTSVREGLGLISADDPGGLSSQNEEDTRILVHQYAHIPIFASLVFSQYAMRKGYIVAGSETIGAAQRGGSVVSHIRISDKPIYAPLISRG